MGVALDAPFVHRIEATSESWPLCHRCSTRLGRPFRVEVMGLVGREAPRNLRDKVRVIVEVECHSERQEFAMDHPTSWGEGLFHDALGQTVCFVNQGGVYGVKRIRDKRKADAR